MINIRCSWFDENSPLYFEYKDMELGVSETFGMIIDQGIGCFRYEDCKKPATTVKERLG